MNSNSQCSGKNPRSMIEVATFANFLVIGLLAVMYYFFITNGNGQFIQGQANKTVHIAELHSSNNLTPSPTNEQGNMDNQLLNQLNNRNVVIGSTAKQIDEALIQCLQFNKECQRSWYEDELERSVSVQPFSLDKLEVTVAQFEQFVEHHGYTTDAEKSGMSYSVVKPYEEYSVSSTADLNWRTTYSGNSANFPVVHVTQKDAASYCASLQKRLPTEAEWEYVASGHKRLTYPWGQQWDESKLQWGGSVEPNHVKPVASYTPTLLGHYDLAGGVAEWTSTTTDTHKGALIKGASRFDTNVANARITVRRLESLNYSGEDVGFRCVQELEQWPE